MLSPARISTALGLCTMLTGISAVFSVSAIDFEKDIRPIFKAHCIECHGAKKQKGDLRLDATVFAFKGGATGDTIIPKDAQRSHLFQRITSINDDERMPPKGPQLTSAQKTLIYDWIKHGADWPESESDREAALDKRLQHWSFKPIIEPNIPKARIGPIRNPIDSFIQDKLQEHQLRPSPEADRRTLIRRLYTDLLGLPPSPEEVSSFLEDADPKAYENLVDRLLDSPHYGERWARHWLDIAHYADTHGFERDQLRPNAWRYRDYVIDSLNADKPYDHFLREQIAGDVLSPDNPECVIATGFLAAGPWDFVGQVETRSDVLRRTARAGDLDDMLTQVMTSTMGLTINCARCHDHKLDPITQKEYYQLTSIFAGVKRAERNADNSEVKKLVQEKAALEKQAAALSAEIAQLSGAPIDLADIVGGGRGNGTGEKNSGILLGNGSITKTKQGYHKDIKPNQYRRVTSKDTPAFIHGVFLPQSPGPVEIAEGVVLNDLPKASTTHTWDVVRNGPLNAQTLTTVKGIDYASGNHSILGLHANAAITFDLREIRRTSKAEALRFTTVVAFGTTTDNGVADFTVYVDGETKARRLKMRKRESEVLDIPLPSTARFLTLMATDGGDGIGHDLLFFGDPHIRPEQTTPNQMTDADKIRLTQLRTELDKVTRSLSELPQPVKVYAVVTEPPSPIHVLRRGNPEDRQEQVSPGVLSCIPSKAPVFDKETNTSEGEARLKLAEWITSTDNPLTRRVLVNRLWHHHFGKGLMDTPSDFGLGGGRPSHPELLDWLANEFLRSGWSIKTMHRLICNSATYRQTSIPLLAETSYKPTAIDASNRLLWKQNPRRLDAESLRDAVLAVSGNLNPARGGPGFRDFEYIEAYAPIYRYTTANKPELWRRSIYRFIVRTTPHQFLTTLDCPDPANLTPARVVTTTALQALALSNNEFMLQQADALASSISRKSGLSPKAQIISVFERAFQRRPNDRELAAAQELVEKQGLFALCRMLLNANEFVYID